VGDFAEGPTNGFDNMRMVVAHRCAILAQGKVKDTSPVNGLDPEALRTNTISVENSAT
jgi:hypothetical protein